MGFTTGQFLWLLLHVCLILISAQQLWRIYSNSGQSSRLSWVVALTFVPAVFVLIIGQITPLVLAGLTWFLYSERKQNYWVMSASLVVLSIKPHLLYLFWIIFLLWVFDKRLWRLGLSAALLGLSAVLLPVLFDNRVYSEYFALYGVTGISKPIGLACSNVAKRNSNILRCRQNMVAVRANSHCLGVGDPLLGASQTPVALA